MTASQFIDVTGVTYSPQELIKNERNILEALDWKIQGQTIYDILIYAILNGALEDLPSINQPEIGFSKKEGCSYKFQTPNAQFDSSISYEKPFEGFLYFKSDEDNLPSTSHTYMDSLYRKVSSNQVPIEKNNDLELMIENEIFETAKIVQKDFYLLEFDRLKISASLIYKAREDNNLVTLWPKKLENTFGLYLSDFTSEISILKGRLTALKQRKFQLEPKRFVRIAAPTICLKEKIKSIEKVLSEPFPEQILNSDFNPNHRNSVAGGEIMRHPPNIIPQQKYFVNPYNRYLANENHFNFAPKALS